ncbi:MAG: DNA polymerase III subunit gamma/tau [Deltaproteobacteria bacterium]|nr:MAG: DNA polymerase III subunit gamma/tau [Deltaproteobacteria bacterium]
MPYEVFARKWRPQVFEEVKGQEHITQTLKNALTSDRLAHAYLFSGARGVGKTSVARIFAKALNCQQSQGGNPCNTCTSCIEITNGSSVDVQEIDGASNRGIDEIRNLRENIRYLPSHGKYRIYIIDEIHMLTLPAFNALLKTLEEPPEHVKFIFATTEPHKVPATILSRCQRFDFRRIPILEIEQQIKRIIKEEGIRISDSGISVIAREAGGSLRDAESLLDQVVSFTGPNVEDDHITSVLGLIDRDLIYKTSQAIIGGDSKLCLEIIDQVYNYGYDIKVFYREIMGQFRNLIVSLISQEPSQIMDLPDNELKETKKQAKHAGLERLLQSLSFLINREADLRYTNNPRIALEAILLKLSRLMEYLSFDELIKRIEDIEKRLNKPIPREQSKDLEAAFSKKEYPPKETPPDNGKKWSEFLRYLATKNKAIANILREWKSYTVTEHTLELPYGEGSFTGSYFDDPEHYEQLVAYVQDFFQSNLKVVFKKRNDRKDLRKGSGEDRLPGPVKDIVDMFEGKIVSQD